MRVCFFARVDDLETLERVQFYATDLRILRELRHEVTIATRFRDLDVGADVYFIWWWTWAFGPLLLSKLRRRPAVVVGVFNHCSLRERDSPQSFFRRPIAEQVLLRIALRWATANVFSSRSELQEMTDLLCAPRSRSIPLAIDTNAYVPRRGPKGRFLLTVAWSSRENAHRKCLFQVVRAFHLVRARFPGVRLVLAGKKGTAHDALVSLAKELGVDSFIDFVGPISEEHKISLMQECAAYVQPTLYEGFGVAIAEAMACEASVVSSPCGAIPEVVGPYGTMVDGRDYESVAEGIFEVLVSPDLAEARRRAARAHIVANFSLDRRRAEIASLLDSFCAGDR